MLVTWLQKNTYSSLLPRMVLLNNNAERKGLWMQNLVWSCIESGKRKTASLRLEEVEYSYLFYYSFSVKNGKKYNIVNIYT